MAIFVMAGGGLFFVATSIVGVRLLVLARRNNSLPELLLGLAFLIGGMIGGSFGQYVQIAVATGSHPPEVLGQMTLASTVVAVVGLGFYNAFTWCVFRRETRWAPALVAAIVSLGIAMIGWYQVTGVFQTGIQPSLERLILSASSALGPIWATLEGCRYTRLMSRRVTLGLADPVVANRFLLWSIGGFCATAIIVGGLPAIYLPVTHPVVQLHRVLIGVLGTLASVMYGLAFFPPRAYLAWLRGAQPSS